MKLYRKHMLYREYITKMAKLSLGELYPFPLRQTEDEEVQFLIKPWNMLQIVLPSMDSQAEQALRTGMVKGGLLYRNGAMLWLFQFYSDSDGGKPLLSFYAPFDIRQLPPDQRYLEGDFREQRQRLVEVYGIDSNAILRAVREISLPQELMLEFMDAVHDQLAENNTGQQQIHQWLALDMSALMVQCKMWVLGDNGH